MWKNYLKIGWRVLKKNRLYTVLNVLGLTMGISGFLMIMIFIQDEVNYDRFYPDSESVFRITSHWGDYSTASYATAPPSLGPRIQADIPKVEAVTRVLKWNDFTIQPGSGNNKDQVFREEHVFYAEPNFFAVFDLNLLAGNKDKALADARNVVITESLGHKYFGDVSPYEMIGKTIFMGSNNPDPKQIAGVVEDIPAQSHFHFDMLVYEPGMNAEIFDSENWSWSILHTYAKFPKEKQQVVTEKLDQMVAAYAIPTMDGEDENSDYNLQVMPVQDIHLNSHLLREHEANGYQSYIYIFSLVAEFVLLLACINFMNLATAKAGLRSMEVGVRKVMGSQKSQLVYQFLVEALILVLISVVLSLLVVSLSNGLFNQLTGKNLQFDLLQNSMILWMFPALIIILTLLSGFYPAFYLSSFKPLQIITRQLSVGKNSHSFRNGLVVFQFATSLTLIICTLLVQRQMSFIQNSDPGFERDQLVIIHNDGEIQNSQREDFKGHFAYSTNVQSLSFSTGIPMSGQFQMRSFKLPTSELEQGMNWYEGDASYLDTYQFKLLEGRNFGETSGADQNKVVMNETAAKQLGISGDAVGQLIIKNAGENDEATLEVIGLVEDFNFESFRNEIKPLVIEYMNDYFLRDYISVKIQGGNIEAGVDELNVAWKKFEPRVPMNYSFLDEDFGRVYESEMKMANLLQVLTGISILIACLGLFGLTAYTTELRNKEIGIRKVFGATMPEIFMMLSASYFKLILISMLIAVPLATVFMQRWLEDFAYKTGIEIWVIVMAIVACFGLALATIFFQTYKSIRANPVKALKSE
ncbi:putative ABC transport system permease protein [Algoriphagus ratkowskyi]|uniref:FtsX-like permease family protein n=1 Tax=Algoriphagus ratkowskyi TaxID=57028 RepID=A0A2W7QXZ1_9BACT|nr:ABC transporter permease [Algoriphagus ratkowskyi]PZX52801.1 putative ABC transport system permease protein [Algoriphagus ratkowskyi]TXD76258.1 FtsX-like permease family protein [Algoriphagus ratkowskyi]